MKIRSLILCLFLFALSVSPAFAARGLFVSRTADCSDVKAPEGSTATGIVTYCLPGLGADQNQLMAWNGAAWVRAIAGGAGSTTFLALTDTPADYTGQGGKLAAVNSAEDAVEFVDPYVSGPTAHDAPGASTNPVLTGGYASAAAPVDVSADGDAVRNWNLRNGAQVVAVQAGGDLIGGDATNGLKVQVTAAPNTAVTGPLTNTELRATPVPVSGTVTITDGAGALNVTVDSGTTTVTQGTGSNLHTVIDSGNVTVSGTVTANAGSGTMAVSATSLPLPSGAATSALQDGIIKDGAGDTTQANVSSGMLHVDGSGVTQPVSGTVTVTDGAGALNVIIDSGTTAATQSGTWTVQPGNTANTTPWLASISQGGNTAAVNASSQLSVNCANCSGSGVSQQDNTGFTPGTTNFVPMGGEVDDVATTAVDENSAGSARITPQRALHVNLRDQSGNEVSVGGGTQYDQGTAGTSTDKLSMAGAVRKDTAAVDAGVADGDRAVLSTDSVGRLRVTSADTTQPISGTVTANAGSGTFTVSGTVTANAGTGTLAVSAASLPLPTGAATAALQDGIIKDGAGDTTQANVSSGRLHVDGSGVTQPVSGTVTANPGTGTMAVSGPLTDTQLRATPVPISGTVTVTDGAGALNVICDSGCSGSGGTSAADDADFTPGTTAGTPSMGVYESSPTSVTDGDMGVVGITPTRALRVWLDSQLDEVNDAITVYGSDDGGTTKRLIKTDSGGAVQVDIESGVNVSQINGVTPLMGAGNTGTGSPRVTIASDQAPVTVRAGNSNAIISCTNNAFLNMTTATTTEIVALSGSTIIYVCHYSIVSNGATATTVKFVGGTGTNCATSQDDRSAGIPLTAATNTVGISAGSGQGMILKTSTAGDALCVTSSGAATIGVNVSYAQF